MPAYEIVKALHIVSATILFGTGLGIAAMFFVGATKGPMVVRAAIARLTVMADMMFTLPAVVVQPLTGLWLMRAAGFTWDAPWLQATIALYALAGACWIPVVFIQMRMRKMLAAAADGAAFDDGRFAHLYRWWFALGWPAFLGLVAIFWLMVAKPA